VERARNSAKGGKSEGAKGKPLGQGLCLLFNLSRFRALTLSRLFPPYFRLISATGRLQQAL
jgi:hypothetical protein